MAGNCGVSQKGAGLRLAGHLGFIIHVLLLFACSPPGVQQNCGLCARPALPVILILHSGEQEGSDVWLLERSVGSLNLGLLTSWHMQKVFGHHSLQLLDHGDSLSPPRGGKLDPINRKCPRSPEAALREAGGV